MPPCSLTDLRVQCKALDFAFFVERCFAQPEITLDDVIPRELKPICPTKRRLQHLKGKVNTSAICQTLFTHQGVCCLLLLNAPSGSQ